MNINLVLAGGVSLGAYAAGAFAPLQEARLVPGWIAASSVGAVNAAIAGADRHGADDGGDPIAPVRSGLGLDPSFR